MSDPDVVIIGGGLAGLCCGRRLAQCGVSFRVLEASDGVGGRVRTDTLDGFRLDRGFQLYLTGYAEGRRVLDLPTLDLKPFTRGALIRHAGRFHRLVDPRADFLGGLKSAVSPVGSAVDKWKLVQLKWEADRTDPATAAEQLTLDFLRWKCGFGEQFVQQFFRPFLGGVFLDRDLKTSSRFFRFVFRAFAAGPGAVPAAGMQAIPEQIAAGLPTDSVLCVTAVERFEMGEVVLQGGERLRARAVVVATDGTAAARLTDGAVIDPGWNGSATLYYAATASPVGEPILVLDGDGRGPVNSLVVLSDVAPSYAPAGQSLVSASVVGVPADGDDELDRRCRGQLRDWYGPAVEGWRLLRVYRIPQSLPDQTAGKLDPWQRPVRLRPGLYVCGDHRDSGSIDGAMTSGFRAAQAVAEDLAGKLT